MRTYETHEVPIDLMEPVPDPYRFDIALIRELAKLTDNNGRTEDAVAEDSSPPAVKP